ncbi:MAG TPA: hypothetical protein VFH93_12315, partial [Thermoleophilia bacterium]|nr:hypothetical protein [Thermoleophilia bacterium]
SWHGTPANPPHADIESVLNADRSFRNVTVDVRAKAGGGYQGNELEVMGEFVPTGGGAAANGLGVPHAPTGEEAEKMIENALESRLYNRGAQPQGGGFQYRFSTMRRTAADDTGGLSAEIPAMKDWLCECSWGEAAEMGYEEVEDMIRSSSDKDILAAIDRNYDGGLAGWLEDGRLDVEARLAGRHVAAPRYRSPNRPGRAPKSWFESIKDWALPAALAGGMAMGLGSMVTPDMPGAAADPRADVAQTVDAPADAPAPAFTEQPGASGAELKGFDEGWDTDDPSPAPDTEHPERMSVEMLRDMDTWLGDQSRGGYDSLLEGLNRLVEKNPTILPDHFIAAWQAGYNNKPWPVGQDIDLNRAYLLGEMARDALGRATPGGTPGSSGSSGSSGLQQDRAPRDDTGDPGLDSTRGHGWPHPGPDADFGPKGGRRRRTAQSDLDDEGDEGDRMSDFFFKKRRPGYSFVAEVSWTGGTAAAQAAPRLERALQKGGGMAIAPAHDVVVDVLDSAGGGYQGNKVEVSGKWEVTTPIPASDFMLDDSGELDRSSEHYERDFVSDLKDAASHHCARDVDVRMVSFRRYARKGGRVVASAPIAVRLRGRRIVAQMDGIDGLVDALIQMLVPGSEAVMASPLDDSGELMQMQPQLVPLESVVEGVSDSERDEVADEAIDADDVLEPEVEPASRGEADGMGCECDSLGQELGLGEPTEEVVITIIDLEGAGGMRL